MATSPCVVFADQVRRTPRLGPAPEAGGRGQYRLRQLVEPDALERDGERLAAAGQAVRVDAGAEADDLAAGHFRHRDGERRRHVDVVDEDDGKAVPDPRLDRAERTGREIAVRTGRHPVEEGAVVVGAAVHRPLLRGGIDRDPPFGAGRRRPEREQDFALARGRGDLGSPAEIASFGRTARDLDVVEGARLVERENQAARSRPRRERFYMWFDVRTDIVEFAFDAED